MAFRTGQEKIDQLTMNISNPNVVGSGFIEHPPQQPFANRVLVQPATIKPEEVPDWYDSQGILHHGPRPGGAGGRGQQGYPQRGGYSTGRAYQSSQRHGGGGGVPGYHASAAPRPQQQRQQQQQQPRPQHHQPRSAVQPGVYDTSTLMNSVQQQQQQPTAPRSAAPAPPPAPRPTPAEPEPDEEKKLSKSAKAKLRKKMREAKS